MKIPPYLQKGDLIGIVAPSGYMPFDQMETCVNTLQDWGFNVRLGATTHSYSQDYFSASDEQRIQDLQEMLDDREVKAILCARGGYGLSRMIDQISFRKFKKHPKWIVGFSDITVLHSHIYATLGIATMHAPMAAAFNEEGWSNPYVVSLQKALHGDPAAYECPPQPFNREGEAEGELIGGNLSLLAHLIGSDSDVKTKNRILFLEDIGEYLYNVDRMLIQLKRSGKLDKLAGLVIGGFTGMKDTSRPYGKTVHEIIYDQIKEYDYPVCFDFPVSHEAPNYALKIGVKHRLQVGSTRVSLTELTNSDNNGKAEF